MLNELVILRSAMTRSGEYAFDSDIGAETLPMTSLRAATNVTAMIVGFCAALLGMVVLSVAI